MPNKAQQNIANFIDHFSKLTVRIQRVNDDGTLAGRSSGFLYHPATRQVPLVITAGHGTPKNGSYIETRVQQDGQTLLINAGIFHVFYNHNEIDYAYSELPVALYDEHLKQSEGTELLVYRHFFVNAQKDEAYGFAVVNNYEFVKNGDTYLLPSYSCYEVGLELIDQTEHLNYFKLPADFKGHEYYEGASGSPIADGEGAINSILINGDAEKELLIGFRLDNIRLPE